MDHFIFETYGLIGFGSMKNNFPSTQESNPESRGDISANAFRIGIQPNFGYKSKHFEVALSSRIVNLMYNNIKGDLIFGGEKSNRILRREQIKLPDRTSYNP